MTTHRWNNNHRSTAHTRYRATALLCILSVASACTSSDSTRISTEAAETATPPITDSAGGQTDRDPDDDLLDDDLFDEALYAETQVAWKERSFQGNSDYVITEVQGVEVIEASTEGQASVLYKRERINLLETDSISWRWRVDAVYDNTLERTRGGDDFPARVYVVYQAGLSPLNTLTINYVWSSSEPVGASWLNPYTDRARMVVLQSGAANAGEWVTETRNVVEDFQQYFDRDITELSGYAVMIDGDNTGSSGRSAFSHLQFE